jgi:riboflavin kinase/FMN adenylyltransferase
MILFLDAFENLPPDAQHCALTIGNFDGVHRGHHAIVKQVRALADSVSGPAVVFTFDPPPAKLLRPAEAPAALTEIHRRAELLSKLGIDYVVVFPTTPELLQLEPEEFFQQVVCDTFKAKAIAEGENFCFGRKRRGDIAMLKALCQSNGIEFSVLEPQREDDAWISSTRIRSLIEAGDVVAANALLVEPYRIAGKVVQGAARGRTLGFPTANLENIHVLCPPVGVYAGRVAACDSKADQPSPIGLPVAINIGPNPTFGESHLKVESHIVGYQGDIYDCNLAIELLAKLRDVKKFASKDELLAQLRVDVEQTIAINQGGIEKLM